MLEMSKMLNAYKMSKIPITPITIQLLDKFLAFFYHFKILHEFEKKI